MNSGGKRTLLSVVAAAHNEAANIAAMHEGIIQAVTDLDVDLELIFIDDGSSDATAKIVEDLAARDGRVRLVALTRNFGHQAAVYAGLSASNGQAIIVLDCDLQHPPALIPKMVDAWRMGYSVVQMVRDRTPATGSMKQATSRAFYRLINLISDTQILEGAADFRLLD